MADKPKYDQQYCEKHNQKYADFLNECPICVGEKLDGTIRGSVNERIQASNSDKKRPKHPDEISKVDALTGNLKLL